MTDTNDTFGTIELFCDEIGCETSEQFEGFDGHVDFTQMSRDARASGWKIVNRNGNWNHYCPDHNTENK